MKKTLLKKLLALLFSTVITSVANGQHWLASVSGQTAEFSGDYRGNHLAVDATGNTYTTGTYRAPTSSTAQTFTPAFSHGQTGASGTSSFSVDIARLLTNTTTNKDNSFITKTNASGEIEWMVGFGSTSTDGGKNTITNTVAVNDDDLYVGGNFNTTIDYVSPSFAGAPNNITSTNGTDGLVFKLSTDGAYVWHKIFGGPGSQSVTGVTTDASGNLFVIGTFATELTIDGSTAILSAGSTDFFLAKFNTAGTLMFLKTFGETGTETVWGLATDVNNSVYISGSFSGSTTIGTTALTGTGTTAYLAKFDVNGDPVWAKSVISTGTGVGHSIAVDSESSLGSRGVYLTGNVVNDGADIDFAGLAVALSNGTGTNPFVAKFNAETGSGIWAKVFKSAGSAGAYVVSVNANKEVFAGGFARNINIDGVDITTATGDDGYIVKMDPNNGTVIDRKIIATLPGTNGVATDRVTGLVATNSAVYVNGIAGGSGDSPTASPTNPKVTPNFAGTGQDYAYRGGSWDIFILKWGSTTLPVSFGSFNGKSTPQGNILSWETLSETNNQYFELERSADGINFSSIKRLSGAGDSNEKLSYTYLDQTPLKGLNYYRLRQVDVNGSVSYSQNIVAINNQLETAALQLYPNPGSGVVNVRLSSESTGVEIKVYNQSGKLVKTFTDVSGLTYSIDISDQASGVYFIQVLENGKSSLVKYIKQ